tara:strand:- start:47 stop:301 length:255 start_codon:yes stop_codon:yes gene_type:complete
MPRHDMINGVAVPFTAEQEAARDIEEAKHLSDIEAKKLVQYQYDRQKTYPPMGDQLDALWKGGQAETDMKAVIDAVKSAHPKPV